ncbi:MAG: hypothetical protein Q4D04_12835 [Clostridia bacterium]|nr:hypothetical protein [Clostridia bacterium]
MVKRNSPWVVIYIAHSSKRREAVTRLLTNEGFMVKARGIAKALDGEDECYEILALSSEAGQAREILQEAGL